MSEVNHASRAHALLSPSSSHRWLACTPSARLEDRYENATSEAAEEGTTAHEACEHLLRGTMTVEDLYDDPKYTSDMVSHAEEYAAYIKEIANGISTGADIYVESKIDLTAYVPDCFGHADAAVVGNGILHVIDYKYGKGVRVEAKDNSQMRLYALGVLRWAEMIYDDLEAIRMTIYQPRISNISTTEVSRDELLRWAEETLKPLAQKAYAGEGDLNEGSHCRFCKHFSLCKAQLSAFEEITEHEGADPSTLTKEEIESILSRCDDSIKWLESVYEYAQAKAVSGEMKYSGFKVVEGRSVRKFTDYEKVADKLRSEGYNDDQIYTKKPLGLGDMEKLLKGKKRFEELLGQLVEKPLGKPTLVPESDKRQEYNVINNF
ncbi:DUF2800 domain-containing protein [Porphyromonas cangingivalis]|uniref:DUF2800 domain-containing protein n=1 Tax=Porphyromonas cangingivalis TaxID=36874 RepID=UPI00242FA92D|nr:DUF2800 domain-containing protein [Porphyromonas cangingivalis]